MIAILARIEQAVRIGRSHFHRSRLVPLCEVVEMTFGSK